jgi:uncharacterized membrane protein
MDAIPGQVPPVPAHPGFVARLRAYLIAGVLFTAPIGVTLWIAWSLIDWVDGAVQGLIPEQYNPERYLPFVVPGFGILVLVGVLMLVGMLTAGYFGRLALRFAENVLARMPVVRGIYTAVKQIFGNVLGARSSTLRDVIAVEAPRRGIWSVGFLSGTTQGEVQRVLGGDMVNVIIPNAPNPTTGFLYFARRSEVVHLDMTAEEGLKLLVSGGIVTPPERAPVLVASEGGPPTPTRVVS